VKGQAVNRSLVLLTMMLGAIAVPARAELKVGDVAPAFATDAARGGKQVPFVLADALKQGPVILYFYPQGPSETCYIENYEFSFVADKLEAAGIGVLGVSSAPISAVMQTSLLECSDKLTLAPDPSTELIKSYAAENSQKPGYALSVGYVIDPDGRIIYARTNDAKDAVEHVADMVRAAETWVAGRGR
jgi:peroxiredoxin